MCCCVEVVGNFVGVVVGNVLSWIVVVVVGKVVGLVAGNGAIVDCLLLRLLLLLL